MNFVASASGLSILLLGIGSCSSDESPASCDSEALEVLSFVRAHKACASDAECTTIGVDCAVSAEHCSSSYAISTAHDPAALEALVTSLSECAGQCGGCVAGPPESICLKGQCVFDM